MLASSNAPVNLLISSKSSSSLLARTIYGVQTTPSGVGVAIVILYSFIFTVERAAIQTIATKKNSF